METWNAFKIGWSYGAYSGKTVSFMFDGALITGTLNRSDGSVPGKVMLVVDGTAFFLDNMDLVEVH